VKQRSTIQWHGELPVEGYTIIPNELARDGYLSAYARSTALYLWSHKSGFKVSAGSIATYLGVGKTTAARALNELIEHGWLTRIELTTKAGRVFGYQYYANRSGRIRHRTVPPRERLR
jgi:predicted ArsR family transcriptional regulator